MADYGFMAELRIREKRKEFGVSGETLAARINLSTSYFTRLESGDRPIKFDQLTRIADVLGVKVTSLISDGDEQEIQTVPEVNVKAGAGGGGLDFEVFNTMDGAVQISTDAVRAEWGLPESFLRSELHIEPNQAWVIEIMGDSGYDPDTPHAPGSFFPGDRVIIDLGDITPSPPGAFLMWDGLGLTVKWVEIVPKSDPAMLRLVSRNKSYSPYEVVEDEARIIGRVRGKISAM